MNFGGQFIFRVFDELIWIRLGSDRADPFAFWFRSFLVQVTSLPTSSCCPPAVSHCE